MSEIGNRIKQFAMTKESSIREFESKCGFSFGVIARESNIRVDNLAKIMSIYPDIDAIWILTGEKSPAHAIVPLNAESPQNGQIEGENDYLRRVVKSQQALIQSQQELINAMMQVKGM